MRLKSFLVKLDSILELDLADMLFAVGVSFRKPDDVLLHLILSFLLLVDGVEALHSEPGPSLPTSSGLSF